MLSHAILSLLFLFPFHASAADVFTGKVVGISDGDTITVLHDGKGERIRPHAVDCPENGQAFGNHAKRLTSDLTFGQVVTVRPVDVDRYGRTVGEVVLSDGKSLSEELVRQGVCWWYRKYAPSNTTLERLEKEAREAKRGLWVDTNPIPPWVYRKTKQGLSPQPGSEGGSIGSPAAGQAEGNNVLAPSTSISPSPILGNRRSRLYHRPDCPDYNDISPKNRVPFASVADAIAAGYRQAGSCP